MRIAINATTIDPGGTMTVVRGVTQGLREAVPDCDISVVASLKETFKAVKSLERADRVEQILPGASVARLVLWQNTQLGSWLRARQIDVLLTMNLFVRNIRCPQVVYHLNQLRFSDRKFEWSSAMSEWVRDRMARKALGSADANVFCSEFLLRTAQRCRRSPIRNAAVIYYGRPEESVTGEVNALPSPGESRRILAITTPNDHKDNPTLMRMLAELVKRDPRSNWHLDIAGGTDLSAWEPTRTLARSLGIIDRVSWHGFCDRKVLSEFFRRSLCYVTTSPIEAFPTTVPEAMAHSCPPVVANSSAMPEAIGDAGLLADPGSPVSFAEAVLRLAESEEFRKQLVQRGERWVQRFRWFECGQRFHRLFEEVCSHKRQR